MSTLRISIHPVINNHSLIMGTDNLESCLISVYKITISKNAKNIQSANDTLYSHSQAATKPFGWDLVLFVWYAGCCVGMRWIGEKKLKHVYWSHSIFLPFKFGFQNDSLYSLGKSNRKKSKTLTGWEIQNIFHIRTNQLSDQESASLGEI